MQQENRKQIADFYDQYSDQQKKIWVNIRHRSIMQRLQKNGLDTTSNVLEIGCGVGTLTSLLVKKAGKVLAIDISPTSIELAKKNLCNRSNIQFLVSDMSDFTSTEKFDLIVLPDVLEHIPIEQHAALFATLKRVLASHGKICIHIPDPYALEWIRKHTPELMQIIDQSLYTDQLLDAIYPHQLTLHKLERYCLQKELPDYQWIELIHRPEYIDFNKKEYKKAVIDEIKSRL
ncbi:MAG: class I SAM-dependent methyltransferase [Flavobacteriales bacterium]